MNDLKKNETKPANSNKEAEKIGPATSVPPKETAPKKPATGAKPSRAMRALLAILLTIAGAAGGIAALPWVSERLPIVAEWTGTSGANDQMLANLQDQLNTQQSQLNRLDQTTLNHARKLDQLDQLAQSGTEVSNSSDEVSPSFDDALLNQLTDKITALEEQLNQQTTASVKQAQEVEQDQAQSARIDMLLARMGQLESAFVPLSKNLIESGEAKQERAELYETSEKQTDQIAELADRIARVEEFANRDVSGAQLANGVAQLRRTIAQGLPYEQDLERLKTLASTGSLKDNAAFNAALDQLAAYADQGLKLPQKLTQDFKSLIPNMISTSHLNEDAPWWQKAWVAASNLITIRNRENPQGFEGVLKAIEDALNSYDLAEALDVIKTMPKQVQSLLEEWIFAAELWLQSDESLATLENIAGEAYLKTPEEIMQDNNEGTAL